eukprot:TRINITY_DN781793_c0_g1_i1.p1 TRINITY_DN781793_c0_g1~~TRINITY_DN781793_c0_g1_i1.p1  ORF type:complete len:491 (-),score=121.11 TRINITY_DN781793_c0_g1_i1:104-1576(-)
MNRSGVKSYGKDKGRLRAKKAVNIRKQKRLEFMHKRKLNESTNDEALEGIPFEELPKMINDTNNETILRGVRELRKLLARTDDNVELLIRSEMLNRVFILLENSDPEIQFEATWVLTNVGSTDYTHVLHGAIESLFKLLRHPEARIRDQTIWCIGNILGDQTEDATLLMNMGVVNMLIDNINSGNPEILANAVWALSNICRSQPKLDVIRPILPVAWRCAASGDERIERDAFWALNYCTQNEEALEGWTEEMVKTVVIKLGSASNIVLVPCLRIVGNILTSEDEDLTQYVLDSGGLEVLLNLLANDTRLIKKEVLWSLSNITAGTQEQIDSFLVHGEAVRYVMQEGLTNPNLHLRREAVFVICNAINGKFPSHIRIMCENGLLQWLGMVFQQISEASEVKMIEAVLLSLSAVLEVGSADANELYKKTLEEADVFEKLVSLQDHDNRIIYDASTKILVTYCDVEDEELDIEVSGNGSYAFAENTMPSQFDF